MVEKGRGTKFWAQKPRTRGVRARGGRARGGYDCNRNRLTVVLNAKVNPQFQTKSAHMHGLHAGTV